MNPKTTCLFQFFWLRAYLHFNLFTNSELTHYDSQLLEAAMEFMKKFLNCKNINIIPFQLFVPKATCSATSKPVYMIQHIHRFHSITNNPNQITTKFLRILTPCNFGCKFMVEVSHVWERAQTEVQPTWNCSMGKLRPTPFCRILSIQVNKVGTKLLSCMLSFVFP